MQPIFIKGFLPEQILNLCNSYSIIKFSNQKKFDLDGMTNSFIKEKSDYLMETILDMSTPVIEQNVGKKLFPTYSYFRIYDKGDDLKAHIDRHSCEYTVALCLGSDPIDKPYDLFLGTKDDTSEYQYLDDKNKFIRLKVHNRFPMLANDAVIFKGKEKLHWREQSQHDHFITVFLHYVDQEGPYKEWKFDQRPMLGAKD